MHEGCLMFQEEMKLMMGCEIITQTGNRQHAGEGQQAKGSKKDDDT